MYTDPPAGDIFSCLPKMPHSPSSSFLPPTGSPHIVAYGTSNATSRVCFPHDLPPLPADAVPAAVTTLRPSLCCRDHALPSARPRAPSRPWRLTPPLPRPRGLTPLPHAEACTGSAARLPHDLAHDELVTTCWSSSSYAGGMSVEREAEAKDSGGGTG
jgi:hypothetical protein